MRGEGVCSFRRRDFCMSGVRQMTYKTCIPIGIHLGFKPGFNRVTNQLFEDPG